MSGKRRRTPGLVRVICTHDKHEGTREYADHGFHLVCTMELRPMADGGYRLSLNKTSPGAVGPAKCAIHENSEVTYTFACSCGRDPQRREQELVSAVLALFELKRATDPRATRVDLNIMFI